MARPHPIAFAVVCGCVLPPEPLDSDDSFFDSAPSVERDPPPEGWTGDCSLTLATVCADCDVTIDWSGATTSRDEPFDPSDPDFVALWLYEETSPPANLAHDLCSGGDYVRPDALSYADGIHVTSIVLGTDLPRVTSVGIFEVGFGFEYFKAILKPDPESIDAFVELQ